MVRVSVGAATDTGAVRELNEDRYYAGSNLWAVADGMGGHAAGDVASGIVVSALAGIDTTGLVQSAIIDALMASNSAALDYGDRHPESRGLGSTVAGLARIDIGGADHWAVFNVGDARVYRLYGGVLSRATTDHSEVEEMILQGLITPDEARSHSKRSIVTRSIGTFPPPLIDLWVLPQTPGESFMICSDGLTGELPDDTISAILAAESEPSRAAERLVESAVRAGGRDNVSVVVVSVQDLTVASDVEDRTNPRANLISEVE